MTINAVYHCLRDMRRSVSNHESATIAIPSIFAPCLRSFGRLGLKSSISAYFATVPRFTRSRLAISARNSPCRSRLLISCTMGIGIAMILSFPERRPAATGRIKSDWQLGNIQVTEPMPLTSPQDDDDAGKTISPHCGKHRSTCQTNIEAIHSRKSERDDGREETRAVREGVAGHAARPLPAELVRLQYMRCAVIEEVDRFLGKGPGGDPDALTNGEKAIVAEKPGTHAPKDLPAALHLARRTFFHQIGAMRHDRY